MIFRVLPTLVSAFIALQFSTALAQFPETQCYHVDHSAHERDRNVDVTHMDLSVKFDAPKGIVYGKVTHVLKPLQSTIDTIFFDAPGIEINSAILDDKQPLKFRIIPTGVICFTQLSKMVSQNKVIGNYYHKPFSITFEYTAKPKKGIYFIGWNLANLSGSQPPAYDPVRMSRKQIWTQGQGIDNRHWIPMIDDRGDKFTTVVTVEFDSKYSVLSNGQLAKKSVAKTGLTSWTYQMTKPHSGYLLMLAIDNYAIKSSKTKNGTPIHLWYYPEHPERVEPTNRYSEKIIEFLENETGIPYPWGSYSQVMVQDFMFGAMENTSATVFGDFFWVDNRSFLDRNYIGVNAHEATHQWFGDLITGRHDGEQWLQESFATYYPGLFMGFAMGKDEMDWYFRGQQAGALAAGKQNSLPVRHSGSGSSRHYPKGASVLRMLQHILGDANFKRSITLYLQRHQYSTVETWDLQKAIIDATGINMDWFFDQWIHRGGEPHFKISWQLLSPELNNTAGTEITVEQIQTQDPVVGIFKTPVDIAVYYTDGSVTRKTVMIDKAFQKIIVPNAGAMMENSDKQPLSIDKNVAFVLFDEGNYLLKNITFPKTTQELLYQFTMADNATDRYDALVQLPHNNKEVHEAIAKASTKETFREMQVAIHKYLIQHAENQFTYTGNNDNLKTVYAQAFNHPIAEVRRMAVESVTLWEESKNYFLSALKDSSYITIETALNRMWNHPLFADKQTLILEQLNGVDGYLNNITIKQLELSAINFPDQSTRFKSNLVTLTSAYYEFRTRASAMAALKRLNYLNETMAHNLFDASLSFNSRLAQPANETINYFKQQTQYHVLLFKAINSYKFSSESDKIRIKKLIGNP